MTAMAKAAIGKKYALFTSKLDFNLRKKIVECCILDSFVWCRNFDTSHSRSEISGNFCWRRMEKNSWTDRARNEEVLHRVKAERNIVQRIKKKGG